MRRRKRIISFVSVLSVLLVLSGVFASGVVDVSKLPLLGAGTVEPTQVQPLSSTASVSVDPTAIIKDWWNDPGYQINDKFFLHINISDVTDLFAWQLNITWNTAMLNVSRIVTGNNATYILYQTTSVNKTASFKLGWVVNATDYAKGYTSAAESILDNSVGASGVSSTGWLRMVSIEFEILDYGTSTITVSSTGTLATTLLNSTAPPNNVITFTTTDGYFKNKVTGDASGDGYVNSLDLGTLNGNWAPGGGADRDVDTNDDGYINSLDLGVVNGNWLRNRYSPP